MKKILAGLASLLIVFSFATTVHAGVNDFTISDYQIDYYLSKDENGRSTLKTVEKITAEFPNFDQNHGIERAIPDIYDNHPTQLQVDQSLNSSGDPTNNTSTYSDNNNTVLRIGSADTYVHGTKTYDISYSQRDVTRYFVDTDMDEFYWDTNGVDWKVPIKKLTVRLHMDSSLASGFTGRTSCYVGSSGERNPCDFRANGGVYTVTATDLEPGENVTIATAFYKGTFAGYQPSLWERITQAWGMVTAVTSFTAAGIIFWLIARWRSKSNRKKDVGFIVPEYIPPRDMSVTAAAEVLDMPQGVMTAQILDLAVRHYIKIIQTKEKSTFKQAEYDLEIIKPIDDLKAEEQELIKDLFSSNTQVGATMSMKTLRSGTGFYTRLQNNSDDLEKLIRGEYGLRIQFAQENAWFKRTGWILLVLSIVLLSPLMLAASLTSFIIGSILWQLTDKGVELRRYLLGLKMYIQVAEEERIKMLQSPEGAAKVGVSVDGNNPGQLVKLYERVLPYAVLFGLEKEWNKQLGVYYESTNTQPSWYTGSNAFNAAAFSSGMNSFSSGVTYASPSSSSSGGSGGGGFSGGGGGGGSGGGW